MIKVLFLPLNYGDVVQNGMYDAFRDAGVELEVFDYLQLFESKKNNNDVRQMLINKAALFRPDLLHLQIQHTNVIDFQTILKIKQMLPKTIITNWTGDVRNYVPETYKQIAVAADYNLISSTGQVDMFKTAINKPIYYWQIGYNPKLYYPTNNPKTRYEWDVTFIANNNVVESYPGRRDRERICQILSQNFGSRFALFGNHWPSDFNCKGSVDQKTVGDIYHNSFSVLSVSHFNDLDHYFSDRLLMCMASGRPTISYRFPKWESYFTNNSDIIIADSIEDIPNKVNWLLQNPLQAEFIGESGAAKVFAEHTYASRVNELLELVGLR